MLWVECGRRLCDVAHIVGLWGDSVRIEIWVQRTSSHYRLTDTRSGPIGPSYIHTCHARSRVHGFVAKNRCSQAQPLPHIARRWLASARACDAVLFERFSVLDLVLLPAALAAHRAAGVGAVTQVRACVPQSCSI